nr:UbiA family prenyltransferase [Cryobacterium sp. Sr3]
MALFSAVFVSPLLLALAAVMLMLGLHYSAGAKPAKRHGARALLVASAGVYVTYIAGAAAYAGVITTDVLVFALVMSLWTLAVGSTKGFGEMEGDAACGRRTLPIVFGLRAAVRLSAAVALLVAFIGAIAALTTQSVWPLALLLPAAAILCVQLGVVTASAGRLELRRPYRAFMVSQFAVNGLAAASFARGAVRSAL